MQHYIAARMMATMHVLKARLEDRERGASALEYVGMVLVAAILVAAVVTAAKAADVTGKVGELIDDIFKGNPPN